MFFPFDPYLLRRSARFLSLGDSYNTWGGSHRGYSAASHESSDDELEVLESKLFAPAQLAWQAIATCFDGLATALAFSSVIALPPHADLDLGQLDRWLSA